MERLKLFLSLAVLAPIAACDEPPLEQPNGDPPPSWGVPITGGTMVTTRDGTRAIIADPDRDRVLTFDIGKREVIGEVALPGGEPGRLVEDGAGRVHVALRRGNELVAIDAATGQLAFRRPACTEPRGVAWDAATDTVHVACASGELASFAAAGGNATRVLRLDRDLRDVIVQGDKLVVTRFRSAELLTIDANGTIASRAVPPNVRRFAGFGGALPPAGGGSSDGKVDAIPAVAWRTIALPNGRIVMSHQRQVQKELEPDMPDGYGGGCGGDGPAEAAITVVDPGQGPRAAHTLAHGALPVDIALAPSGGSMAIVMAGDKSVHIANVIAMEEGDEDPCESPHPEDLVAPIHDQLGSPTSVAWLPDETLLVYYPELPALAIHKGNASTSVRLPGDLGYDSGRALFHTQTPSGLACASCHPEGREDGLVWHFANMGPRRTQNLAGHLLQRAPFHWTGDQKDLPTLMSDVFAIRMSGGEPSRSQKLSLGPWLDRLPAPQSAPPVDAAAAERGKALFESADTACTTCHNGELLSNKVIVDVGTAGKFKVPSLLGIGARAPFMHTGAAKTLTERFGPAGGGDAHGHTSQLTPAQVSDLVAYLETL